MTFPPKKPFFPETESPSHNALSVIPACQSISQPTSNRSHPNVPPGLRHGDPTHNALSATPACQSITQPTSNRSHPSIPPGPRHGDPTHNALSAIPAWQRGLPAALRHGNPTHRYLSGILAEPLLVGASDSSRNGLREIHLARAVIDYQVVSN